MEFWQSVLTERSWDILKDLKGRFDFVLIGEWAVYLWARTHKSRDIDIVVDFENLSKIRKEYDLRKNVHLKKYEIRIKEMDIDIYVNHFSGLPLLDRMESTLIEGFKVARIEELLILKQSAEIERRHSLKGEKDRIDIVSILLKCDISTKKYRELLKSINREDLKKRLIDIVSGFSEGKYLDLNPRQLKLERERILKDLKAS